MTKACLANPQWTHLEVKTQIHEHGYVQLRIQEQTLP